MGLPLPYFTTGWRVSSDLGQLDDESAADVSFEAVASELPDPDVVGELDVVVFGEHAAAVALERARLDDVRDLGYAQRALQFLVGRHVQRMVARDAQSVHCLVPTTTQATNRRLNDLHTHTHTHTPV